MKFPVLLVTLSALVISQAAVVKEPEGRASLSVGTPSTGDTLAHNQVYSRAASFNAVQATDVRWTAGNSRARITALIAQDLDPTQFANASIIAGGVGSNTVTVRLQSAVSRGFNYRLQIWTRNNASKLTMNLSVLSILLVTIAYFSSSDM